MRRLWILAVLALALAALLSATGRPALPPGLALPAFAAPAAAQPSNVDIVAERKAEQGPPAAKAPASGSVVSTLLADSSLYQFKTAVSAGVTVLICLFGIVVIKVMAKAAEGGSKDQLLRSLIIVTIVIASLILIVAGFSTDQIAPAFGLFGTIVGYMLGRLNQSTDLAPPPAPPPPPADGAGAQPPVGGGI